MIMSASDKGKAKALATASTLQKVVCPAPERDPQEILSKGWRKVGEQKKITNRLANGHPDYGVGMILPSQPSVPDFAAQSGKLTGRAVLDKMFGHLRPHLNIPPGVDLRTSGSTEEQELETNLGTYAARMAYFRPAIATELHETRLLATAPRKCGGAGGDEPASHGSSRGGAAVATVNTTIPTTTATTVITNTVGNIAAKPPGWQPTFVPGHGISDCNGSNDSGGCGGCGGSNSSKASVGNCNVRLYGDGGGDGGDQSSWSPMKHGGNSGSSDGGISRRHCGSTATATEVAVVTSGRQEGSLRTGGSGALGGSSSPGTAGGWGGNPGLKAEGGGGRSSTQLPVVLISYPGDGACLSRMTAHSHPTHLPVAAGATAFATVNGGSGGGGLPRRRRASISGYISLPIIPPSSSLPGRSPHGEGLTRRTSLTGCLPYPESPSRLHGARRMSVVGSTGGGDGSGGGNGNGGGMPQLRRVSNTGIAQCGGISGGGGGRPDYLLDSLHSPTTAAIAVERAKAQSNFNRHGPAAAGGDIIRGGCEGRGGEGPMALRTARSTQAHVVQLAQTVTVDGSSTAAASTGNPVAMDLAVPLSGMEHLAATGLGDAITQLRHIRMGTVALGGREGGGGGGSGNGGGSKEVRKAEAGSVGMLPTQLLLPLGVPLPLLDNWHGTSKQVPELDPCKGIRLVDAPNCVLPRPMETASLQVRMAHHQAAMLDLVKAEGTPMSESEMDAVTLLGRLERSGARHRNFQSIATHDVNGPVEQDLQEAQPPQQQQQQIHSRPKAKQQQQQQHYTWQIAEGDENEEEAGQ